MPQTRSKGQVPASRVYSSSPAPQQVHFPSRQKSVRTYGKQGMKRSLRQQTITQIDFLEPLGPEELDEFEEAEEREFERRKKRRRTEGNEGLQVEESFGAEEGRKGKKGRRKTEGDGPSSSFHTQTLTQLYGDCAIPDSEDEDEGAMGGVAARGMKSPSVIPQTPLKKTTRMEIPSSQPSPCTPMLLRYSPLGPKASPLKSRSTNVGSPLPTPRKMGRTPRGLVIQDSFASGVTMESGVSQASVGGVKGGDSSQRLPSSGGKGLGEAATQGSGGGSGRKVFQRVEIPDSDAEDEDDDFGFDVSGDVTTLTIPDTPTKRLDSGTRASLGPPGPLPMKAAEDRADRNERVLETPTKRVEFVTQASRRSSGPSQKKGLEGKINRSEGVPDPPTRLFDSGVQAVSSSSGPSPGKGRDDQADRGERIPDTPTKRVDFAAQASRRTSGLSQEKGPEDKADTDEGGAEGGVNSYPVGPDTQFAMDFIASSEDHALRLSGAPQSPRPAADITNPSSLSSSRPIHKSPTLKTTPQCRKSGVVHFSSPHVSFEDEFRSSAQHKTQAYTQMGSQRVDFDVIRSMPAATGRSDVFISIHPEHVKNIANGTMDHEFRTWKMPVTVSRIWIYVTKPESTLRYMACVGPAKERGQIEDETGLGNAEFNRGEGGAKFAHEILELYELNNPVSMNRMRVNGWLEVPPQRFTFVPPVVVSQLQANLRCRVLPGAGEEDGDVLQDSQPRDSQEVEAQLLSDIAYSTQRAADASSQGMSRLSRDGLLSSASRSFRSQREDGRGQQGPEGKAGEQVVAWSQATTASDDSVPRPANPSSSMPLFHDSGSPVRMPEGDWGVDTSQLVGISQLLPGSLLRDCGPPEDFNL